MGGVEELKDCVKKMLNPLTLSATIWKQEMAF